MECRKPEITLVSANSLPDIRNLGRMKVYAKVSIKGEIETSQKTPVDMEGETNPTWNFPIEYTISESAIQQPGIKLAIRLYCERTFASNKFIGQVNIPIKSLFDKGLKADKILSFQVAGTSNGRLNIFYSFGEMFLAQKPSGRSGWKDALGVGFLVVFGGTMLLLGDKCVDDDDVHALPVSRDVHVFRNNDEDDVDDEGRVFYDAC